MFGEFKNDKVRLIATTTVLPIVLMSTDDGLVDVL